VSQGLSAWINTYLARASIPPITTLPDDITDGVRLLQFLELLTEKPVGPFKKDPTNRIQKIENCSKAIKFISNDLQIRLVGIGAEGLSPPPAFALVRPLCAPFTHKSNAEWN
jgi:hypothetical protein